MRGNGTFSGLEKAVLSLLPVISLPQRGGEPTGGLVLGISVRSEDGSTIKGGACKLEEAAFDLYSEGMTPQDASFESSEGVLALTKNRVGGVIEMANNKDAAFSQSVSHSLCLEEYDDTGVAFIRPHPYNENQLGLLSEERKQLVSNGVSYPFSGRIYQSESMKFVKGILWDEYIMQGYNAFLDTLESLVASTPIRRILVVGIHAQQVALAITFRGMSQVTVEYLEEDSSYLAQAQKPNVQSFHHQSIENFNGTGYDLVLLDHFEVEPSETVLDSIKSQAATWTNSGNVSDVFTFNFSSL